MLQGITLQAELRWQFYEKLCIYQTTDFIIHIIKRSLYTCQLAARMCEGTTSKEISDLVLVVQIVP